MLDEEFIATLEVGLRETRNAQNRLMGRLQEAENEVELLRQEINALENSAVQTEVKGKGEMQTYFLTGVKESPR